MYGTFENTISNNGDSNGDSNADSNVDSNVDNFGLCKTDCMFQINIIQQHYDIFENKKSNGDNCAFFGFCFFLLFNIGQVIGLDIGMIVIGADHKDAVCDDNYNYNYHWLSQWLIIFGSIHIAICVLYVFPYVLLKMCFKISSKALDIVASVMTLIWIIFTFLMNIILIVELVYVVSICVLYDHFFIFMVKISIGLKFVTIFVIFIIC